MNAIACSLLLCGPLAPAADEKPEPLRYVRPDGNRFAVVSEVTMTATRDGTTYVSKTYGGEENLTLTVRSDRDGKALAAEVVLEQGTTKKTATIDLQGNRPAFKRGGITDFFTAPANPIVTSAPDWTDVFELVRRYDAKKAGKQEFGGVWFHPTKNLLTPTFTVEKVGTDKVKHKDKEVALDRYTVKLRSGEYKVWADAGRVCRIVPGGDKAVPVILEGWEETTRDLK